MKPDYSSFAPCIVTRNGAAVLIERLRFIPLTELPGGSNGTGQGRAASTQARSPDGVAILSAPSGHCSPCVADN